MNENEKPTLTNEQMIQLAVIDEAVDSIRDALRELRGALDGANALPGEYVASVRRQRVQLRALVDAIDATPVR